MGGIPVIRNADGILERNADSTRLILLQLDQGNGHVCNFRLRSKYDVISGTPVMDGFQFYFGVDADGSNYDRNLRIKHTVIRQTGSSLV